MVDSFPALLGLETNRPPHGAPRWWPAPRGQSLYCRREAACLGLAPHPRAEPTLRRGDRTYGALRRRPAASPHGSDTVWKISRARYRGPPQRRYLFIIMSGYIDYKMTQIQMGMYNHNYNFSSLALNEIMGLYTPSGLRNMTYWIEIQDIESIHKMKCRRASLPDGRWLSECLL